MRRTVASLVAVMGIVFVLGVGSKFSVFEQSLFTRRQNTVDSRLDNYQMAWNAFAANPMFGLGYGNFTLQWKDYFDRSSSRLRLGLDDGNHSTILGLLADLGIVGTVPFVLLVVASTLLCWMAYRRFKAGRSLLEVYATIIGLLGVLIFVVLSLTNDLKAQPALNTVTLWWVGVVSSLYSYGLTSEPAMPVAQELRRQKPSARIRFTLGVTQGIRR
jgi:O-antigen ligase